MTFVTGEPCPDQEESGMNAQEPLMGARAAPWRTQGRPCRTGEAARNRRAGPDPAPAEPSGCARG